MDMTHDWEQFKTEMDLMQPLEEPNAEEIYAKKWNQFCDAFKAPPSARNVKLAQSSMMPEKRVQIALKWLEKPIASLLLYGPAGCGKTYWMWCLIKELLRKKPLSSVRFERGKNLDDKILLSLHQHKTAEHILETIRDVPYLFIDEFGDEKTTERVQRDYLDILNHRVEWEKPTIFTTNLMPQNISEHLGSRIASRLQTFHHLPFGGVDLRPQLKKDFGI